MELTETILKAVFNFALFVVLSVLFLPAFLIVTYLQDTWSDKLKEVFGI